MIINRKNFVKYFIFLIAIFILSILFISLQVNASDNDNDQGNIILKSTYNLSQIEQDDLNKINEIVSNDKDNVNLIKSGDDLTIYTQLPNKNNDQEIGYKDGSENTKIIDFSSFIHNMDEMNNENNDQDGELLYKMGKAYNGQKSGDYVKPGTHVHCNRFNGPMSFHRYYGQKNPKAWISFIGSDCFLHASEYGCGVNYKNSESFSYYSEMTKCDGLNNYKKGVKDCSSWSGGLPHSNWDKTVWYRN